MPINTVKCECGARLNYVVNENDYTKEITCTRCGKIRNVGEEDISERARNEIKDLSHFNTELTSESFVKMFNAVSPSSVEDTVNDMEEKFARSKKEAVATKIKPTRKFKEVNYANDIVASVNKFADTANAGTGSTTAANDTLAELSQIRPWFNRTLNAAGLSDGDADEVFSFIEYMVQEKNGSTSITRDDISRYAQRYGFNENSVQVMLSLYDKGYFKKIIQMIRK